MLYITGAGGFIGRALTQHLKDFTLCREDITDGIKYTGPVDTVIHLAGRINISLPEPAKTGFGELYKANVLGTANVLEFCLSRGVKNLVFISSQSVYGMPTDIPLTEESPCKPLEHYAMSKYCAEQILALASGLSINVLRIPGVFSENRRSGIVWGFCEQAKRGHIDVRGDYPLPLDVIHMADVVSAIQRAVNHLNGYSVFNIATGQPCSLDILADTIASITGCTVKHSRVAQPVVIMDASKAKRELGWQSEPLEARLREVIASC